MVGHVERFNPAVQSIKRAIQDQDILSIAITRVGPFPPRMSNVGVVIDLAVHDIDLIRWFTDSEIVEIQPQTSSAVAEREDIALLQFRTASGVLGAHQHQLADAVQGAHHPYRHPRQISHRRSVDAAGHRMLRLPAGRQLFDAASVGRLCGAAALGACRLRQRHPQRPAAGRDRRGSRRQPRNRHPLPRRALRAVGRCRSAKARDASSAESSIFLPGSQQRAVNIDHESAYPRGREADPLHRCRGPAPPPRPRHRRCGGARLDALPVRPGSGGARIRSRRSPRSAARGMRSAAPAAPTRCFWC